MGDFLGVLEIRRMVCIRRLYKPILQYSHIKETGHRYFEKEPALPGICRKADSMDHSLYLVSSTMLWSLPPEDWFRIAEEEGLAGVEVWAQQLDSRKISADTVRRLAIQHGMAVTVHNYSWDMNLISLDASMRAAAVALTKKGIELAAFFHAPQITIHPGRDGLGIPGADFDQELADSFVYLSRYAEEEGVRASFEIMEKIPKERLTSASAVLRVEALTRGRISWGYTEDVAHCDSVEEIFHTAEVLKGRVWEFHVSNKKGTARHIGDVEHGDFQLPQILPKLEAYGLPMALEGFDPSPTAARLYRTLAWLRKGNEELGIKNSELRKIAL